MHYYEVLVGDLQYHGNEALTYSFSDPVPTGSIVVVSLRSRQVLGIITKEVVEPPFKTKPITRLQATKAPFPTQLLALADWIRSYYPAPSGSIMRLFLPGDTVNPKSPVGQAERINTVALPTLTTEQKNVLSAMTDPGSYLLHGSTGSGKTRVYLELAARAFQLGRSALILTPEIGLTGQLVINFEAQFPGQVVVLHSQLTAATRRNLWYKILNSSTPLIVIGPRSALFAPLKSVGLIVIDESHETAYKNESAPHYLTSRVAGKLANLHNATLVLGSATPSVDDYFFAKNKGRPILTMTESATSTAKRELDAVIVDMKDRSLFVRSQLLSEALLDRIGSALASHEQTLLYLNRRGTAKVVLCTTCGWQMLCPRCDLPLTYHGDQHLMRCHACGFKTDFPNNCPKCSNTDILLKSIGTKALAAEVAKLFPSARISRFDSDNLKSDRLEQHITTLKSGTVDILIGTQTIAKGLDLPKLSVVGIVNADTGLYIPDYTASERTYQLLTQVLGRVGRGHRKGYAVIQSYAPENQTLLAVTQNDWNNFLNQELREREQFRFPPYYYLLKLSCGRSTAERAEAASNKLAATIQQRYSRVIVDGPSPAFHTREAGKYKWQLIIKAKDRKLLTNIIDELPSGWSYDIDPVNLL